MNNDNNFRVKVDEIREMTPEELSEALKKKEEKLSERIIARGEDKRFIHTCGVCQSDFWYKFKDVTEVYSGYVTRCPACGHECGVKLEPADDLIFFEPPELPLELFAPKAIKKAFLHEAKHNKLEIGDEVITSCMNVKGVVVIIKEGYICVKNKYEKILCTPEMCKKTGRHYKPEEIIKYLDGE